MRSIKDTVSYFAIFLAAIATALLWLANWMLGLSFTAFMVVVAIWYLRTKRRGVAYLKEVAKRTGCKFQDGKFGYGRVSGFYKGYEIEVSVDGGYDALRGLSGFMISDTIFNSTAGILAGIKNFTSIRVKHKAHIEAPFKFDDRTYVDEHLIIYLPPSNDVTGIPKCKPPSLVARINRMIKEAKRMEAKARVTHRG